MRPPRENTNYKSKYSPASKYLGRRYAYFQKVTQNYKNIYIWPSVHQEENKKCCKSLDVN